MPIFAWLNIYMKKRIHKLFFYTLLVGVYGVFFSIESFYNFEGQINARDIMQVGADISYPAKDGRVTRATPLHSSSSHSLRLNKRYYQEDMPPCPVLAPQPPVLLLTPLVLGSHRSAKLCNIALLHRTLRGPPAIG